MIVTLIPHPEFAPVPFVEIRLDESGAGESVVIPEGTDTITVWWSSEGRSDKVAGAVRRGLGDAFGHQDVEAGFNVPTSYELECLSGTQPLGRVPLGTVTLPWVGDVNGCLIQQPLDPYLNATVTNLAGSWPELAWEAPGELVGTQGAEYPSLVGFGPFLGATGVPIDFGAPTREISRQVKATLGIQAAQQFGGQSNRQLPVWLIRTHQGLLPRRFYARVQTLREVDINSRSGKTWSRFVSTVTEIARPAPGLQISPLSYDDLDVSYAGYDERDAAYASYAAMDTDWSLAGAAG